MKTSCWTSHSSWTLALCLLLPLGACDSDADDKGDCWNQDSPSGASHPDGTKHRGQITVEHAVEYEGGPTGKTSRAVLATFADFSQAYMESRKSDLNIGDLTCYGLTGAPYKVCTDPSPGAPCSVETLDADKVEVEGLGSGKVTLERTGPGKFSDLDVQEPLFGATPVKVVVASAGGTDNFPAFDQTLEPPDVLELRSPSPTAASVGAGDLEVGWKPGNGDLLVLDIAPGDPTSTDKVRCILADDGCHTLMVGALEWLEITPGTQFRLILKRVRSTVKSLDSNTSTQLTLVSRVEALLTR
jgi:hypothetical protein